MRVPFPLQSKSNFRRHIGRKHAGASWESSQSFERSLGLFTRQARPSDWLLDDPKVSLAQRPIVTAFIIAKSLIDAANFSKSVTDAVEGVLYVSDASALGVGSLGTRGRGSSFCVGFAQVAPATSLSDLWVAKKALGDLVLAQFLLPDATSEKR